MNFSVKPLPFDIQEVYGATAVRREDFIMDVELKGRIPKGHARIRYLTDFIFVKNGKLVFPDFLSCNDFFWDGVEVYGFMAGATTSINRWYIWALQWWHGNIQVELVRLDHINGIQKCSDPLYRNGNEEALWLVTKQSYIYALMEPDGTIADLWRKKVIPTWRNEGTGGLPDCMPADPSQLQPDWWHERNKETGIAAWNSLQKAFLKRQAREEEESDDEVASGSRKRRRSVGGDKDLPVEDESAAPAAKKGRPRTSTGATRNKVPAPSTETRASTSTTATKRKLNPPRKSLPYIDVSDEEDSASTPPVSSPVPGTGRSPGSSCLGSPPPAPAPSGVEEENADLSAPQAPTGDLTPPSSNSSEVDDDEPKTTNERPQDVGPVGSPEQTDPQEGKVNSAGQKSRMQREADHGYEPGPNTQQANSLPALGPAESLAVAELHTQRGLSSPGAQINKATEGGSAADTDHAVRKEAPVPGRDPAETTVQGSGSSSGDRPGDVSNLGAAPASAEPPTSPAAVSNTEGPRAAPNAAAPVATHLVKQVPKSARFYDSAEDAGSSRRHGTRPPV